MAQQQGNSARTKARRRAVEIIFEATQRELSPLQVVESRRVNTEQIINPYTTEILGGVSAHRAEIDEFLQTYAQGWTLERMPSVDLAVLRVGAWELLYNDDVPDAVAVSEATELAKELSTDESPQFVNGLLGKLQEMKHVLLA